MDVMIQLLLTWLPAGLTLLAALWLAWPALRQRRRQRALERAIGATATAQLRHVLLDDGMGGQSFFDWLLLTPQGIRVLQISRRDGAIFAGERMDSWAQMQNRRTEHFSNPLHGLDAALATLRYHLPGLPVSGNILFIGQCSFPKGRPAAVLTLDELSGLDIAGRAAAPDQTSAWSSLVEKARKVDPVSEGYLLPLGDETPKGRWLLILMLLLIAGGWLLWRLW